MIWDTAPLPPNKFDYPREVLGEILRHLPAHDLHSARLACKNLAQAGRLPSLPGWQDSFQWAIPWEPAPDKVVALVAKAAKRGVLSHINKLDLSRQQLGATHIKEIRRLGKRLRFNRMRDLNLSHNRDLGDAAIDVLKTFKSLHSLNVSGCGVSNAGVTALAASRNSRFLLHLNLSSSPRLSELGLQALATSKHLKSLRSLDLSSNLMGDPLSVLTRSENLRFLERLNLRKMGLVDKDAAALAASEHLACLQTLRLEYNCMSNAGAAALASSESLGALRSLSLVGNGRIGHAGISALYVAEGKGLRTDLCLSLSMR